MFFAFILMCSSQTTYIEILINFGSDVAFHAIISLQVSALMLTYGISIACALHRRLTRPDILPTARWSLGRFGTPVNIFGLSYVSVVFFWSFWPGSEFVTPARFNSVCLLFSSIFFHLPWTCTSSRARKSAKVLSRRSELPDLISMFSGSGVQFAEKLA